MKAITDYINGNLTDAKRGARGKSHRKIRERLQEHHGYNLKAATAVADWIKGDLEWQKCCDIVHGEGY